MAARFTAPKWTSTITTRSPGAPEKPTSEQADSLRLSILRELIDNEILMQRAEKLGLLATDEEVQGKLAEIKAPYTQEEFDKRLKEQQPHPGRSQARPAANADHRQGDQQGNHFARSTVTDDDITDYYNQHKAEFNLIEPQYHLAQILVTTQPNPQVGIERDESAERRRRAQEDPA